MFRFCRRSLVLSVSELDKKLLVARERKRLEEEKRKTEAIGLQYTKPEESDVEIAQRLHIAPPDRIDVKKVAQEKVRRDQAVMAVDSERKAHAEAFSRWRDLQLDKGFAKRVMKRAQRSRSHKRQTQDSQRWRLLPVDPIGSDGWPRPPTRNRQSAGYGPGTGLGGVDPVDPPNYTLFK